MQEQQNKLPMMLHHLTKSNFSEIYAPEEEFFNGSSYSDTLKMNLTSNGTPLYCARSNTPPTQTYTAGHTIPPGYTSSGKHKPGKTVPAKSDKRVGK